MICKENLSAGGFLDIPPRQQSCCLQLSRKPGAKNAAKEKGSVPKTQPAVLVLVLWPGLCAEVRICSRDVRKKKLGVTLNFWVLV